MKTILKAMTAYSGTLPVVPEMIARQPWISSTKLVPSHARAIHQKTARDPKNWSSCSYCFLQRTRRFAMWNIVNVGTV